GGSFDRNASAGERLAGDEAFTEGGGRRPANPRDRPEEIDQRGDIVRAHVEHWATALLVEKLRIRMPVLVTVGEREREGCDGTANESIVDGLARSLDASAKKSIGGAADEQV